MTPRGPGTLLWAAAVAVAACGPRARPVPPLPAIAPPAESLRVDTLAPGLVHTYVWIARGPWAVHILDVDLAACWSVAALKAGDAAVGRERTSVLVNAAARAARSDVAAGVNADFFAFDPPGLPVGPHVGGGRVITGPWVRPVFAVDSAGVPSIGRLSAPGLLFVGDVTLQLAGWNQPRHAGLVLYDRHYGPVTDTASGAVEVVLRGSPGRVVGVDTAVAGVAIPQNGSVVVAPRTAPAYARAMLAAVTPGSAVRRTVGFTPVRPREAVGGFPVLLSDGRRPQDLDSAGGASFGPVRHPRTAVGLAWAARRLLLVTVDGRQAPYSDGMTLNELADFLLGLGVTDALNLDGGGSTTMVVGRGRGAAAVVNRPSDAEGERPVANALAVVRGCR